MRKLEVRILPNTRDYKKWYYEDKNSHVRDKNITVFELDSEPIFENSYRYGHGGSYFIDKEDCVIIKVLKVESDYTSYKEWA